MLMSFKSTGAHRICKSRQEAHFSVLLLGLSTYGKEEFLLQVCGLADCNVLKAFPHMVCVMSVIKMAMDFVQIYLKCSGLLCGGLLIDTQHHLEEYIQPQ